MEITASRELTEVRQLLQYYRHMRLIGNAKTLSVQYEKQSVIMTG